MNEYGAMIRACMVKSFSRVMMPARKVMDLTRSCISEQSGIPENVLAGLETGKISMSDTQYVALSAVFDNIMLQNKTFANDKILRRIMEIEYDEPELPEYCAELFKKLEGRAFLYRWFISFGDIFNQLCKTEDEALTDDDLKLLVRNYKIFIDDTVLNDDAFSLFMERIEPFLREENELSGKKVPLRITKDVLSVLEDRAKNTEYQEDKLAVQKVTDLVMNYKEADLLDVFNADSVKDVFDNEDFRAKFRFILITQYKDFAQEVLNPFDESRKAPVLAAYLRDDGNLALYGADKTDDDDEDIDIDGYNSESESESESDDE